jgi:hypothetical protein
LDVPYNQSCGKNELGPRYQNLDTIKKTFKSLSFMVENIKGFASMGLVAPLSSLYARTNYSKICYE